MAQTSNIEWTQATWNPIAGCSIVSPGCTNCYAMKMAARHEAMSAANGRVSPYAGLTKKTKAGAVWNGEMRLVESALALPLTWRKPRTIFVNSMSDLFAEGVPFEWVDHVFGVMALASWHTYQILTKRPDRMREYMRRRRGLLARHMVDAYLMQPDQLKKNARAINVAWPVESVGDLLNPDDIRMRHWPLPNVWLGVSAEDQTRWDMRVPELLWTPAAKRFVSIEPMLGPIETDTIEVMDGDAEVYPLAGTEDCIDEDGEARSAIPPLDWIIVGGESGPGARPMHPDWIRKIRDACSTEGVAFFFKQWGAFKEAFHDHDGPKIDVVDADGDAADAIMALFAGRETVFVSAAGQAVRSHHLNLPEGGAWRLMVKAPKGGNGRLLDGVEHNSMPEVARG